MTKSADPLPPLKPPDPRSLPWWQRRWRQWFTQRLLTRPMASPTPVIPCLTFAGGLLFSGVLIAQLAPASRSGSAQELQEQLWQATGSVRQSVVSLAQAQQMLLSTPPTGTTAPAAAATETAAAPAAAAAPAPSAPAVDPGSTVDTNLEMRVAIAKNHNRLNVGVATDGYLMDLDGQNYCNLGAQSSVVAAPTAQGIRFGDCQLSQAVWLEAAEGGYVYIDDSWFKGRVLLLNEGGQLLAVNFVLLHDYLSSVVGSEMYVNWPLEALKAQAVAARSYALTHHVRSASRHYDLDNTQRYQAYLGVGKETNTTQQAVAATSGEFISYNGGIVESLYAASDQIVQEAHGGQGMSQTGAMQLASQGYSYEQILATYYPETGLSRLVVE